MRCVGERLCFSCGVRLACLGGCGNGRSRYRLIRTHAQVRLGTVRFTSLPGAKRFELPRQKHLRFEGGKIHPDALALRFGRGRCPAARHQKRSCNGCRCRPKSTTRSLRANARLCRKAHHRALEAWLGRLVIDSVMHFVIRLLHQSPSASISPGPSLLSAPRA